MSDLARKNMDFEVARVSRVVVALSLIGIGGIKVMFEPTHEDTMESGLAKVFADRGVSVAAAAVEIGIGLSLFSPWNRRAASALVIWLSVLLGIALAFLVGGVSPGTCGCAGPLSMPLFARILVLFGLFVLTYVSMHAHQE